MSSTGDLRVSSRGQMSLPASTRRRWGLGAGGDVGYLDLGDVILIVPSGTVALRRVILDAVTQADWDHAYVGFGDDELTSQ